MGARALQQKYTINRDPLTQNVRTNLGRPWILISSLSFQEVENLHMKASRWMFFVAKLATVYQTTWNNKYIQVIIGHLTPTLSDV